MAGETLRDLVVSLSLDSDNFKRNIKSVNALMKETDSAFKLAAVGMKDFENTTAGQAAKLEMLRSKYVLQEKAVAQFAGALKAAESKLATSKSKYDQLGTALEQAGRKVKDASENARMAEANFNAVSTATGKNSNAAIAAKAEWQKYKDELAAAEKEQKDIQSRLDRTSKSLQDNADAVTKLKTSLNNAEAEMKDLRREMSLLESSAYNAGKWFENLSGQAEAAGRALETAGRGLTRYISVPIAALGAASLKASIDFETAFTGVRKTVDATETQYRRLAGSIKEMSTEVADSAENIAGVVATAGQLGIANEYLMEFTRTVQDLTVSTEDLKGTDAATQIAKFANIAQMSQEQISNLGSAITYLGNNYATTEGAIMSMALNIAAAGKQVGLSEAQILGLAAGLSSVGLEAEKGGTAMSKALKKMEVAAQIGGQALTDFANVAGMTEEEFRAVWEANPAEAFMAFIDGLARMDEEGISAIATMQEIGLSEVRLSDTILRTVNAQYLFNSALADSEQAWQENTALTEEANKFYETTESRLKNLANRAKNFAARLGDDLNPQVQSLIDLGNSMLESLEGLDSAQVRAITRTGATVASIGVLTLGVGKFSLGVSSATNVIGKAMKAIGDISAAAKAAGTSFAAAAASSTAFSAGIYAIYAAVVAAGAAIYYYTSDIYRMKKAVESLQDTVNDWKTMPAETLFGGEGLGYFGLDESDFREMDATKASIENWRDGLIEVWTDGQKETNDIVNEWTGSFAELTDKTRQQLKDLKENTGGEGSIVAEDIDGDIAALDELDAEIEALLKKRQNKLFTEDDLEALQAAIDKRNAIVVKYNLEPDTKGYDEIAQGIQNEINRAMVEEREVDPKVYEEATLAAAQGYSAITKELEEQYDLKRSILDAEKDEQGISELNTWYLEERKKAAQDYVDILKQSAPNVLDSKEAEEAGTVMDELVGLMADYNNASTEAEKTDAAAAISNAVKNIDKDSLVEYLALIQQITDAGESAGMSQAEIEEAFGTDIDNAMKPYAAILEFLQTAKDGDGFGELKTLFGEILPDEVMTINAELNRDDLEREWKAFVENPGEVFEIEAVIRPTGMDAAAVRAYAENNPVEVTAQVKLGSVYDNPQDAVKDQAARFFDETGVEIDVETVAADDLTENTLVLLSKGEDGTITRDIIVTARAGDYETNKLLEQIQESPLNTLGKGVQGNGGLATDLSLLSKIEGTLRRLQMVTGTGIWDMIFGYTPEQFQSAFDSDFFEDDVNYIAAFVSDIWKKLTEGAPVSEDEIALFDKINELMEGLTDSEYEVGTDLISAIQTEMEEAGWEGTAQEMDEALSEALESYVDVYGAGVDWVEQIAAGMRDSKSMLQAVASMLGFEAAAAFANPGTNPGSNAQGDPTAPAADGYMANVGGAMVESLSLGALKEAPNQARIIGNAARYISTEAGRAIMGGGGYAAHTYNQQQTVNLSGNSFYVRSDQDVQMLAQEIASIMKRRSGGYGG